MKYRFRIIIICSLNWFRQNLCCQNWWDFSACNSLPWLGQEVRICIQWITLVYVSANVLEPDSKWLETHIFWSKLHLLGVLKKTFSFRKEVSCFAWTLTKFGHLGDSCGKSIVTFLQLEPTPEGKVYPGHLLIDSQWIVVWKHLEINQKSFPKKVASR